MRVGRCVWLLGDDDRRRGRSWNRRRSLLRRRHDVHPRRLRGTRRCRPARLKRLLQRLRLSRRWAILIQPTLRIDLQFGAILLVLNHRIFVPEIDALRLRRCRFLPRQESGHLTVPSTVAVVFADWLADGQRRGKLFLSAIFLETFSCSGHRPATNRQQLARLLLLNNSNRLRCFPRLRIRRFIHFCLIVIGLRHGLHRRRRGRVVVHPNRRIRSRGPERLERAALGRRQRRKRAELLIGGLHISVRAIEGPDVLQPTTLLRFPFSPAPLLEIGATIGMPEHDTQAHENDHAPEGKEDREHETLLLECLCV